MKELWEVLIECHLVKSTGKRGVFLTRQGSAILSLTTIFGILLLLCTPVLTALLMPTIALPHRGNPEKTSLSSTRHIKSSPRGSEEIQVWKNNFVLVKRRSKAAATPAKAFPDTIPLSPPIIDKKDRKMDANYQGLLVVQYTCITRCTEGSIVLQNLCGKQHNPRPPPTNCIGYREKESRGGQENRGSAALKVEKASEKNV
jgi:hypothetical protein